MRVNQHRAKTRREENCLAVLEEALTLANLRTYAPTTARRLRTRMLHALRGRGRAASEARHRRERS